MKFRGKVVQKSIRVVVFTEVLSESGLLDYTGQNHCHTTREKKSAPKRKSETI